MISDTVRTTCGTLDAKTDFRYSLSPGLKRIFGLTSWDVEDLHLVSYTVRFILCFTSGSVTRSGCQSWEMTSLTSYDSQQKSPPDCNCPLFMLRHHLRWFPVRIKAENIHQSGSSLCESEKNINKHGWARCSWNCSCPDTINLRWRL